MHTWRLMTDFVIFCYQRGIKVSTAAVYLLFSTYLSNVFFLCTQTPQAESKLENTEGNRNQARCWWANMSNHGQLRGGPVLSAMALLVHEEGVAEEMEAMSEPAWQL